MGYLLDIINKYLANDIQNNINKDESEANLPKSHHKNTKRGTTLFNSSILNTKSPEKKNTNSQITNNQLFNMGHSSPEKKNNNNNNMNKSIEMNKDSPQILEQGINNSKRHINIALSNIKNTEGKDCLNTNNSLSQKNIKNKSQSEIENIKFLEKLKISNDNLFMNDFSRFLENNGIVIDPYTKLIIYVLNIKAV